jgi:hypothetical protein
MKGSCTLVASVLAASTVALSSSSSSAGDRDPSFHPFSNEVQIQYSSFYLFINFLNILLFILLSPCNFQILMQSQILFAVP